MGGDFLAFQIHKDHKYFPIDDERLYDGLKVTVHNMWRFPNLLAPIGLEAKIYPSSRNWNCDKDAISKLNEMYQGKNILLPSHWYKTIDNTTTNGLFNSGIRLFASNRKTLKITYALWWLKSHVIANDIWPHRREEIEEYQGTDYPNKHLLPKVLENYHNWKYNSMRYDILKNGEFDLRFYVENYFDKIYTNSNKITYINSYKFYDVDRIFFSKDDQLRLIEEHLDVKIDRTQMKEYTEKNYSLIEKSLGFSVNDPKFDDDNTYFNSIVEYAKEIINERPYQFDYYNGKCNG